MGWLGSRCRSDMWSTLSGILLEGSSASMSSVALHSCGTGAAGSLLRSVRDLGVVAALNLSTLFIL